MAFSRNRTNNPKMCVEPQETLNSQAILRKEEQGGNVTHRDFKLTLHIARTQVLRWRFSTVVLPHY